MFVPDYYDIDIPRYVFQVACVAESLNSNDVFVLFSKSAVFVWAGKGCTGDEREMAKAVAGISPRYA